MTVRFGTGDTKYGPGVEILLDGNELATAIGAYLTAHSVKISGARTIKVNGGLCEQAYVYVDPSGVVVAGGVKYDGRGPMASNILLR